MGSLYSSLNSRKRIQAKGSCSLEESGNYYNIKLYLDVDVRQKDNSKVNQLINKTHTILCDDYNGIELMIRLLEPYANFKIDNIESVLCTLRTRLHSLPKPFEFRPRLITDSSVSI